MAKMNRLPQKAYIPSQSLVLTVMDMQPEYQVPCPICGKRTIDVTAPSDELVTIRHKCPHCKNIVLTPLKSGHNDNVPPIPA